MTSVFLRLNVYNTENKHSCIFELLRKNIFFCDFTFTRIYLRFSWVRKVELFIKYFQDDILYFGQKTLNLNTITGQLCFTGENLSPFRLVSIFLRSRPLFSFTIASGYPILNPYLIVQYILANFEQGVFKVGNLGQHTYFFNYYLDSSVR